jgi:endonuclease YncB( thermonuclease family)
MALGVASARAFGGACLLVVGFVLGASFGGAIRPLTPRLDAPSIGGQCCVEDALTGPGAGHRCAEVVRRSFRVERVIDGDTLVIAGYDGEATRVRLVGIDAPERGEPGYNQAADALRELVEGSGELVELGLIPGERKRDNFGRLLCRVFVMEWGQRIDAGERLLERGLAERYRSGERDARGD